MNTPKKTKSIETTAHGNTLIDEVLYIATIVGWHQLNDAENNFIRSIRFTTYRARAIIWEMIIAMYIRHFGSDSFIAEMVTPPPPVNEREFRKILSPFFAEVERLRIELGLTNTNDNEWAMIQVMRHLAPPAANVIGEVVKTLMAFHPWVLGIDTDSNTELPEGMDKHRIAEFVEQRRFALNRKTKHAAPAATNRMVEAAS